MRSLTVLSVSVLALGWVVLVGGCPPTVQPVGPAADFYADVVSGGPPLLVQFTNTSLAGSSPITDYHWDFGDGATSTTINPIYSYTEAGDYTVSLTVTTAVGSATMIKQDFIQVGGSIL